MNGDDRIYTMDKIQATKDKSPERTVNKVQTIYRAELELKLGLNETKDELTIVCTLLNGDDRIHTMDKIQVVRDKSLERTVNQVQTIWRSGVELKICRNKTEDNLIIEIYDKISGIYWSTVIIDRCDELFKLFTEASGPDSRSIWRLGNYAIKYPLINDPFVSPVINIWTDVGDPFGSMYNIILRQKKKSKFV